MKVEIGTIVIRVNADAYEDEDGDVTLDGGSTPSLSVDLDLPGTNQVGLAVRYLRRVADDIEGAD